MTDTAREAAQRLAAARAGSTASLGQLWEACRGYLLLIAQQELDPRLRAKAGASDLVQETFLKAQRHFDRFRGDSEAELLAWLRRLLLNNLANFARQFQDTNKRRLGREVRLDADGARGGPGDALAADTPSPSQLAMQSEQAQAMQSALDRLPADYRQVLVLRYQEERSYEEIAGLMERSPNAVRKLWLRAIRCLQQEQASAGPP